MLLLSLSVFRKYIYLTVHISTYLNTSPYSSFTVIFLLESNTSHHYNLSSSSNIIHLPSYISLIHLTKYISLIYLTNYISHKLYIHIPHIYYKLISHQIPILITHTNYKYYITQNIYIFYHLHTSQEIPYTNTKSPSHGRYKLLTLKPFSYKA